MKGSEISRAPLLAPVILSHGNLCPHFSSPGGKWLGIFSEGQVFSLREWTGNQSGWGVGLTGFEGGDGPPANCLARGRFLKELADNMAPVQFDADFCSQNRWGGRSLGQSKFRIFQFAKKRWGRAWRRA